MKHLRHKTTSLSVLFLLCFGAFSLFGEKLEESDASRILLLTRPVNRCEAGTFLVFIALDENENAICEPLSGSKYQEKIPIGAWRSTRYFRETQPYEILMDICKDYSDPWFFHSSQLQEIYRNRCRLLKLLGHQKLTEPLLTLDEILLACSQYVQMQRKVFLELTSASTPDEDAIDDLLKNLHTFYEARIIEALNIVTQALNNDDPMLAIAAYCHIANFHADLASDRARRFYFRKKDGMEELNRSVADLFRQCETNILSLLRRRYGNQTHVHAYRTLFPKSRGLWSESPPVNGKQLREYAANFHRCRDEEHSYAPVADFEQWGNLRLSLLLGTSSRKDAAYLGQEFNTALQKYQQIFSQY